MTILIIYLIGYFVSLLMCRAVIKYELGNLFRNGDLVFGLLASLGSWVTVLGILGLRRWLKIGGK